MTQQLSAEEWLVIAEQELARTRRFLAHGDPFAAYCLESAVKAYLRARYAVVGEHAVDEPATDAGLPALARHAFPTEYEKHWHACDRVASLSRAAQSGAGKGPDITDIRASLVTIEPMLTTIRDGVQARAREET